MKRFTDDMRRWRLARRHQLSRPVGDVDSAVRGLVALHSSDPATVYLTLQARVEGFDVGRLQKALYEDKRLVRIYGMRRTLWVVDRATFPMVDSSSTRPIAESNRRRFEKMLNDGGIAMDGASWLSEMEPRVLSAIRQSGETLARELTPEIEGLSAKLEFFNKRGELVGTSGVTTRLLVQLALETKVIRTRPVGSWISSQYRWTDIEDWLGEAVPTSEPDEAAPQLLRQWLGRFGPASTTDIRWWTGWTAKRVSAALSRIDASEVELDAGIGWVLPDDLEEAPLEEDWVALLPSLDPTVMGWKERDWYLGTHYPTLFDRNGNAGPTIWANGRIVGGWAQRKSGEVVFEIFENLNADLVEQIESRAERLQTWIGDTRVTPRFRSPHDKSLSR